MTEPGQVPIGACKHNKGIHYRYPCPECEAETLVSHIQDGMRAGFVSENGLLARIKKLAVDQFTELIARINQ